MIESGPRRSMGFGRDGWVFLPKYQPHFCLRTCKNKILRGTQALFVDQCYEVSEGVDWVLAEGDDVCVYGGSVLVERE